MKKLLLFIIVYFLCAGTVSAGINTVVAIGDSTTQCVGFVDGESPSKSFTNRLSEKYPGIEFVNLGVGGDTTTAMEARKETIAPYQPYRVIVWGGINDVNISTPAATTEAKLQSLYNYAAGLRAEVWVLTITQKDTWSAAQNALRDEINTWIKTSATNIDRVIDAYDAIGDPDNMNNREPSYVYSGGAATAHFNDAGYAAIIKLFL